MFSSPFGDISNLFAAAAAAANLPSASLPAPQVAHLAAATAQPSLPQTTDLAAATADLLGQSNSSADMTIVTPEATSAGLTALFNELDDIPLSEKAALVYVQQTKPELVGDDEALRFLLVENFKARVSCLKTDFAVARSGFRLTIPPITISNLVRFSTRRKQLAV